MYLPCYKIDDDETKVTIKRIITNFLTELVNKKDIDSFHEMKNPKNMARVM